MDAFTILGRAIPCAWLIVLIVAIAGCARPPDEPTGIGVLDTPAKAEAAEYPAAVFLETPSSAASASFSDDGTRLLVVEQGGSARKGAFQIWDTRTGKPVGPKIHHGYWCRSAHLNDDGSLLFIDSQVAISDSEEVDNQEPDEMDATLWEVRTGKMLGRPFRHGDRTIMDAAISPDWRTIATCNAFDPHVHLWDAATGRLRSSIEEPAALLQFDRSGERLITVGESVRVWNVRTGKLEHEFARAHWAPLGYVRPALSGNGRMAVGTWSGFSVHDVATETLIASPTLKGFYRSGTSEDVQCNALMEIVTVKMETELFAIDLRNMTQLKTPELGPGHFALSPRDAIIAVHSCERCGLWDLRSGHFIDLTALGVIAQGRWDDAAFNAQGDRLAIVTGFGTYVVRVPEDQRRTDD